MGVRKFNRKQHKNVWGSKVIDIFAAYLNIIFRKLKYMISFAEAYPQFPILQVPLARSETQFAQAALAQIITALLKSQNRL